MGKEISFFFFFSSSFFFNKKMLSFISFDGKPARTHDKYVTGTDSY